MLLFGHPYIDFEPFYHIVEINEIERTPANSTLFVHFDESNLDIIRHMKNNHLSYAIEAANLSEVILAHNLGANYILVKENLAKSAQNVAENYLFDAKILCRLTNDVDLEEKIIEGIDGVIYAQAIIKTSN
ncbi:MAG: hypothetical protein PF439_12010 [Helicobacteraceae bacterium]|jgi:hypothetical protein|nr:hypothetical protein [Helicobacteraceae bacterium]